MGADGNHAFLSWVESLARSSQCLFSLLSRPEVWSQSRSRLVVLAVLSWNLSYWKQHAGIMSTMRQSTGNMSLDGVSEWGG